MLELLPKGDGFRLECLVYWCHGLICFILVFAMARP